MDDIRQGAFLRVVRKMTALLRAGRILCSPVAAENYLLLKGIDSSI